MHLTNEMLALLPSNGTPSTTTTSPSSMTSPTMSCYPGGGQYSAFPFTGLPGNSIGCMQTYAAGFNGLSAVTVNALLNGVQAPYNGYNMGGGVPASYAIATNGMSPNGMNGINGMNGVNVSPVTTCTTSAACNASPPYSGLTINGVPFVPPTALTSPEVYGLPPPSMTTATKSSASTDSPSSGETSPAPLSPAASMELVWHGEFDRLFSQYFPHIWCLVPTFSPPSDGWRTFKDSAKVRFSCQDCGHGWTSMKGRVVFWFELNFTNNSGCVMFKLYGQQCQRCKTGKFEHAMWYPEEVVKVIGNVYNRVGQLYYGFVRPPLRIDRRVGKPRNQHNAELCQACKEGLCKEEWSFA